LLKSLKKLFRAAAVTGVAENLGYETSALNLKFRFYALCEALFRARIGLTESAAAIPIKKGYGPTFWD